MRIFTAIALPQTIKDSLKPLLGADIPSSRWVHPDDLHITLRFIGEVTEDELERYKRILATLSVTPFEITLRGLGRFPEKNAASGTSVMGWSGTEPRIDDAARNGSKRTRSGGTPPRQNQQVHPSCDIGAAQRT